MPADDNENALMGSDLEKAKDAIKHLGLAIGLLNDIDEGVREEYALDDAISKAENALEEVENVVGEDDKG